MYVYWNRPPTQAFTRRSATQLHFRAGVLLLMPESGAEQYPAGRPRCLPPGELLVKRVRDEVELAGSHGELRGQFLIHTTSRALWRWRRALPIRHLPDFLLNTVEEWIHLRGGEASLTPGKGGFAVQFHVLMREKGFGASRADGWP